MNKYLTTIVFLSLLSFSQDNNLQWECPPEKYDVNNFENIKNREATQESFIEYVHYFHVCSVNNLDSNMDEFIEIHKIIYDGYYTLPDGLLDSFYLMFSIESFDHLENSIDLKPYNYFSETIGEINEIMLNTYGQNYMSSVMAVIIADSYRNYSLDYSIAILDLLESAAMINESISDRSKVKYNVEGHNAYIRLLSIIQYLKLDDFENSIAQMTIYNKLDLKGDFYWMSDDTLAEDIERAMTSLFETRQAKYQDHPESRKFLEKNLDYLLNLTTPSKLDELKYDLLVNFMAFTTQNLGEPPSCSYLEKLAVLIDHPYFDEYVKNVCESIDIYEYQVRAVNNRGEFWKNMLGEISGEDTEGVNVRAAVDLAYIASIRDSDLQDLFMTSIDVNFINSIYEQLGLDFNSISANDFMNIDEITRENIYELSTTLYGIRNDPDGKWPNGIIRKEVMQKITSIKLPDVKKDLEEILKDFSSDDLSEFDSYYSSLSNIVDTYLAGIDTRSRDKLTNEETTRLYDFLYIYDEIITIFFSEGGLPLFPTIQSNKSKLLSKYIKKVIYDTFHLITTIQHVDYSAFSIDLEAYLHVLAFTSQNEIQDYIRFNYYRAKLKDKGLISLLDSYIENYKLMQQNSKDQILELKENYSSIQLWNMRSRYLDAKRNLQSAIINHPEKEVFRTPDIDEFIGRFAGWRSSNVVILKEDDNSNYFFVIDIRRDPFEKSEITLSLRKINLSEQVINKYIEAVKTYPPLKGFSEAQKEFSDYFTKYYAPCTPLTPNIGIIVEDGYKDFPFHTLMVDHNYHVEFNGKWENWFDEEYESDYRYIAEDCHIGYQPSIQSTYYLSDPFFGLDSIKFHGFGNPTFSDLSFDVFKKRGLANENELKKLINLDESEEEVLEISKLFMDSDIYIGNEATELNVKNGAYGKDSLLYFATHSIPSRSLISNMPGLAFSPPENPNELDDGLLTYEEISNLDLRDTYISTAACSTYENLYFGSQKYSGLPTAFFSAGAKGLLLSMWDIESGSASLFNQYLYTEMVDNKINFQESISRASKKLINSEKYSHPYFWGPYIYMGPSEIFVNFPEK